MGICSSIRSRRAWAVTSSGLVLTALAGCADLLIRASGLLTPGQAQAYASLEPYAFVQQRFYTEERDASSGAIEAIGAVLDKVTPQRPGTNAPSPHRPEALDAIQTITWPAYFTNVNYVQLVKPKADLKRYCEARGGRLIDTELERSNPLANARRSPLLAMLDAEATTFRALSASGSFAFVPNARYLIADRVGAEMAREAAEYNLAIERMFSVEGYGMAQRLGAFGVFRCVDDPHDEWAVSVRSMTLSARRDTNLLNSTSMSRVSIRIFQKSS